MSQQSPAEPLVQFVKGRLTDSQRRGVEKIVEQAAAAAAARTRTAPATRGRYGLPGFEAPGLAPRNKDNPLGLRAGAMPRG